MKNNWPANDLLDVAKTVRPYDPNGEYNEWGIALDQNGEKFVTCEYGAFDPESDEDWRLLFTWCTDNRISFELEPKGLSSDGIQRYVAFLPQGFEYKNGYSYIMEYEDLTDAMIASVLAFISRVERLVAND